MEEKIFSAGFARCKITPEKFGVPLRGYGATHLRLSESVMDDLYAHILCLGNGDKAEVCLITMDLTAVNDTLVAQCRAAVEEATGIPGERVLLGGTHTHSAPDYDSDMPIIQEYLAYIVRQVKATVPLAVQDMKPAKIFFGSAEVGRPGVRLNFCRHYTIAANSDANTETQEKLIYCGDNFNDRLAGDKEHYHYVGHAQEVDPMLQVIRLEREGADNIIMVNWQSHAHIKGGSKKTFITADFPGALVNKVEALIPGSKCIYYNGACGNINPFSRMLSDSLPGLTFGPNRDHYAFAAVLGDYVRRANQNARESTTSTLDFRKRIVTCQRDHSMDHLVEEATLVRTIFMRDGYTQEVKDLCVKHGFNSPYQCGSIMAKAKAPATGTVELNALRIGDVGYATSVGEFFNDLGENIKKFSPFPMTFFKGYANGTGCYFPSAGSPENTYERNTTRFVPGTGELLVQNLVEMLTEMK